MKKFFIATLAVAVATLSQATQVQWSSGDLSQYVTDEIKDVTAYYYVIDKTLYDNLKDMSSADIYDAYKNNLAGANATVEMNALDMANATLNHSDYDPSVSGSAAYVVAIYKFDSKYGGAYALASALSYSEPTANGETQLADPSLFTNDGVADTIYAKNGNSWAAVPEPTTVALLALGLAAVGLKRKVA